MDELRKKGLEKMNEVYGWEMPDMPGEYFALTVDHLFGAIWSRPGLSMRDRRMMLLGVLAAQGMEELIEVQANAILHNEEMTREELREVAIFLTHYVGFPLGSKVDGAVKRVVAKRKKAEEKGAGGDAREARRANVNDAVQMHVGRNLHDK
ncbi:MAG: 4-carboxymuconolactone decarboxylase [Mycobacterium sp.]|jgi:4-carboxymuconolactone decarboxylase|nr:4-carboxymuconolactone decarboxylase [Mycobacterium sp.]